MRICLVSMEWPPEGCGIGTYMYNLARGLGKRGHYVTVITHDRNPVGVENVSLVPVPLPESKRTLWRKVRRWITEPYHTWSKRAYTTFCGLSETEPFDIIETAEFGAWGRYLVGGTDTPVVVRCHNPHHILQKKYEKDKSGGRSLPLWLKVLDGLERDQVLRADGIVSPSYALASHLSLYWGIARSRFEVISNPIDSGLFCPGENQSQKKEILYTGRLDFNKGVFDLAQAAGKILARHKDVRFHFVGMDMDSPEHYRDRGSKSTEVIRSFIPPEYHDRIRFTGHVSVTRIVDYLREAMFAVVPTRGFESFSYTVVEAMSCGCAVVATHCGGPTEIITDGRNGFLVPPGNVEAIEKTMDQLVSDETLCARLGAEARRTVEERYSIDAVMPKIEAMYQKVIEKTKKGNS